MYEYYFTFHTVTLAQKGLAELLRKGIYTELLRSPKRLSSTGCGYALKVSSRDGYAASSALKLAGIGAVKTFRIYANGNSEVALL